MTSVGTACYYPTTASGPPPLSRGGKDRSDPFNYGHGFPLWRKADFGIVAVSELFSIPSDLEKLRYGDNHKHFSVCVYDIIFSVAQNGNLIYKNFKEAKSLCFRNPIRKER